MRLILIILFITLVGILPLILRGPTEPRACEKYAKGGEQIIGTFINGAIPLYRPANPGECLAWVRKKEETMVAFWVVRCDGCGEVIGKTDDTCPRPALYCVACAERKEHEDDDADGRDG